MGGVLHSFCSVFGFYKFICPRPPHFLSPSYAPGNAKSLCNLKKYILGYFEGPRGSSPGVLGYVKVFNLAFVLMFQNKYVHNFRSVGQNFETGPRGSIQGH